MRIAPLVGREGCVSEGPASECRMEKKWEGNLNHPRSFSFICLTSIAALCCSLHTILAEKLPVDNSPPFPRCSLISMFYARSARLSLHRLFSLSVVFALFSLIITSILIVLMSRYSLFLPYSRRLTPVIFMFLSSLLL